MNIYEPPLLFPSPTPMITNSWAELILLLHVCECLSGIGRNLEPLELVGCALCGSASGSLVPFFSQMLSDPSHLNQGNLASVVCKELSSLTEGPSPVCQAPLP